MSQENEIETDDMTDTGLSENGGSIEEQIIRMSKLSFESLPMLDVIFDRFAASAASALKSYTATEVKMSVRDLTHTSFGTAVEAISTPAMLGIVRAKPWDGMLLLSMNADFVFVALEVLLGGQPSKHAVKEDRKFTSIERRIGQRLCEVMLTNLSAAFGQLTDVNFMIDHIAENLQAVSIGKPGDACIDVRLNVEMNGVKGEAAFVIPRTTIESVRPELSKVFFGEKLGSDVAWQSHLTGEIERSNVSLKSILHNFRLPMNEVLAWNVGDTLDLGIDAAHEAQVVCAGIPMFHGAMGKKANGSIALRITEDLNGKEELTHDVIGD